METEVFFTREDTNCIKCKAIIEKDEFSELEPTDIYWKYDNICLKCAGFEDLVADDHDRREARGHHE